MKKTYILILTVLKFTDKICVILCMNAKKLHERYLNNHTFR